ncbi:hypothetical protein Kirov_268 [Bacillus phage Kirov]|uniref:Uncharacterized protein n=1 Tax=Bacillus phage Kirov TaxID=2783539 RepID=A0A7U3RXT7_9CAUD|nr:hypothetical protein PQE67_gp036 [Bacillus phage Kirov]QOV08467.1 hypothetical protein Kirov_268 [Bacillus phage Kirov]
MYYVTMTDNCLSGWGDSQGKKNKLVFECENMKEAMIVERNANNRSDMTYVNIRSTKPYYDSDKCFTQFKTKEDYPKWYTENAF